MLLTSNIFKLFFDKLPSQPHARHAQIQLFADFVTLFRFNEDLFEYAATVFSGANKIISWCWASVNLFEVIYFYLLGKLLFVCVWYASVDYATGTVKYCWFVHFLLFSPFLISMKLQHCRFCIEASKEKGTLSVPFMVFIYSSPLCIWLLSFNTSSACAPNTLAPWQGFCRKRYDSVPNEISARSSLAPRHLLLLRRLFSSNGEAYYCIPLSKSHLEKAR